MIELLLDKGANVKAVNSEAGTTPLHEAAAKGHAETVELLLKRGADPDAKSKNGTTALDEALRYRHAKVVAVFLDRGMKGGSEAGARQLKDAVLRGQFDMVSILLDRGLDPNAGFLLHDAALKGFTEIAQSLIDHGAGVNSRNASGSTPLHDAALAGQISVLNLLLSKGADINAKDTENNATPLHHAASWGRVEVVRALLAAGAGPKMLNKANLTPLQCAAANGHEQIVTMLNQHASRK